MFIGFDLESAANDFYEGIDLLKLGISCAAICESGGGAATVFYDTDILGFTLPRVSQEYARLIADRLIDIAASGKIIITHNGLKFDFPLLDAICGDREYSRQLKRVALEHHIDTGFSMVLDKSFMISLDTAAHALKLSGKTIGMHGSLAPILWNPTRELSEEEILHIKELGVIPGTRSAQSLCLQYVAQDARTSVDVYYALVKKKSIRWVSSRTGRLVRDPWRPEIINGRMLTVAESMQKTPPETPWWPGNPFDKDQMLSWALS